MPDMLVKLYDLPECYDPSRDAAAGIQIKRGMLPDTDKILEFVRGNFSGGWANECHKALFNTPSSCFIAVKDKEIVGFACYDAVARGFFGPVGVKQELRGCGAGKALTLRCLTAMRELGYGYAIIGWVGPADFYAKICGATLIEGSRPGIYRDMAGI